MHRLPTRLATLGRWPARAALVWLLLVCVLGGTLPAVHEPAVTRPGKGDAALYQAITARTAAAGATPDAYYRIAAAEQRAGNYPLRPFVTVREPTLALLSAKIGPAWTSVLMRTVGLIALAALAFRLARVPGRGARIAAPALVLLSAPLLTLPTMLIWHEAWAAALIALGVALRPGRLWPVAVAAILAAALVRELAAPALAAMAFAAIAERRRHEAACWLVAIALFLVALAIHAGHVHAVTLPGDRSSQGWTRFGGWPFLIAIARETSILCLLPAPLVAAALPLALLGWATRGTRAVDGMALALFATLLPFAVFGRPVNVYWGLIVGPLLPVGLAFAPAALADLARAARQGGRARPSGPACTANASS